MEITSAFPRGKTLAIQSKSASPDKERSHSKKRNHDRMEQQEEAPKHDLLFGSKGITQANSDSTSKRSKSTSESKPKRVKPNTKHAANENCTQSHLVNEKATTINFKSIKSNMLLLGLIRDITETGLLISLPSKLNGFVPMEECSDEFYHHLHASSSSSGPNSTIKASKLAPLNAIFSINQYVPCMVLNKSKDDKGKHLVLSMRLSLLHAEYTPNCVKKSMTMYGTIQSMEDQGAVINLGIRGMHAFAPKSQLLAACPEDPECASMLMGRQFLFTVLNVNPHTSTVTLSPARNHTIKAVTRGDHLTVKHLLPGLLLNVRVEQVVSNGLFVNFLTFFHGTVDYNHVSRLIFHDETEDMKTWTLMFKKGIKSRARIIGVDRAEKKIMLSMAPHIVHLDHPFDAHSMPVGSSIDSATIERIDPGIGMLLSLPLFEETPSKNSKLPAYVHISNVSDAHVDKHLDKKYTIGDKMRCRVIGSASFDNIVTVSCKESSLSQTVLRHCDLAPGQHVNAKILVMKEWGVLLEISEGVRGLVTMQHVPSIIASKLTKSKDAIGKFQQGRMVDAQVLHVDTAAKKTFLTMKRALMESQFPILASYKAENGLVTMGYITKIAPFGVIVSFYGGVHGLVPASTLHQAGIECFEDAYTLGQVVRARITYCDTEKQRLLLSLNTTSTPTEVDSKDSLIGSILCDVVVTDIDMEEHVVRVKTPLGLIGNVSFVHLTDFPRHSFLIDLILASIRKDEIWAGQEFLVLSQSTDRVLELSRKPMLTRHISKIPQSIDSVSEKSKLFGFVAAIEPEKGVFVEFLNHLTGFAHKSLVDEKFVQVISSDAFQVGETVVCSVLNKLQGGKFTVDFRARHFTLEHFPSYFAEWSRQVYTETNAYQGFPVGLAVNGEFVAKRSYGSVFSIEDSDFQASVLVRDGIEMDSTSSQKLVLVDFDVEKKVYFGILDEKLARSCTLKRRSRWERLAIDQNLDARVLAIGTLEQYAVVALNVGKRSQIGVVQLSDFWRPLSKCIEEDTRIKCRVVATCLRDTRDSDVIPTPFEELPLLRVCDDHEHRQKPARLLRDAVSMPRYKHPAEEFQVGKLVTGRIATIKQDGMEIKLKATKQCGKVVAMVSIIDVDADENETHPLDQYAPKMAVTGRILTIMQKGANQRKPVSESNPATFHILQLSLRQQDISSDEMEHLRADWGLENKGSKLLTVGNVLEGVVVEQKAWGLLIRLSHRVVGFLHCMEISTELSVLERFHELYPVGKRVNGCHIVSVDHAERRVDLSLIHESKEGITENLQVGNKVIGVVLDSSKKAPFRPPSLMLQLSAYTFGRVCVTELRSPTNWTSQMLQESQFKPGKFLVGTLLSAQKDVWEVTLRSDRQDESYSTYEIGNLVTGIIASTSSMGCFVRINHLLTIRVLLRDLSDNFINDPISEFPVGKVVAGRITAKQVTQDAVLYSMSLKPSIVSDGIASLTMTNLKEGMIVTGKVSKIQSYGVFVRLNQSNLSGLCHISEIGEERIQKPLTELFKEGDSVKAKVLKVENGRISLGFKLAYFDDDIESANIETIDQQRSDDEVQRPEADETSEAQSESESESVNAVEADNTQAVSMEVDTEEEEDVPAVGFQWDEFEASKEESPKAVVKSVCGRNPLWMDEGSVAIREKELALSEQEPQCAQDFERLLTIHPQDAYLWIRYMAFHISLQEVQLARDVAMRATRMIAFRDEKEKLNVWIAYLNLEHDFGDAESFQRVLHSAIQVNPPKSIYLHLVDLYVRSNQHANVLEVLSTMQKKFKTSRAVWIRALRYFVLENSDHVKAAHVISSALKYLPGVKHVDILVKYGLFLYDPRAGKDKSRNAIEKARTVLEGVLATYPKRMDLWNVYADKEIRLCKDTNCTDEDRDRIRQLFERLLAMKFSTKKMKFWFKKYISFEQTFGDQAHVEHVKQLAKSYVEHAMQQ
uniref:rRNA biogenesis protein rrp5 putative n=1 Tax=Albugo laibachii Nc14 TaxID=890382 RepID=F0W157_9STRA|nr:rRNA biogenesis protein rrp5 putative [Albugo laibachii Nc14]|eukprot:CCA14782.1 rRNA biogenesis protein rrp5 putative [Albugo laibachii Nc14]